MSVDVLVFSSEERSNRSPPGVQLTIFTQCILILNSDNSGRRNAKWLMAYSCAIFLLATFGLAGNIKFIQMCYIDYRNYPGGPNAFTINFYSTFVNMFGTSAYVVMNWLADGLMVRPYFFYKYCYSTHSPLFRSYTVLRLFTTESHF